MKDLEKILCIDDEDDILDIVKLCLEATTNIEVFCTNSGEKALTRLPDIRPDMILLDVMMPIMSGMETLKQIRKEESCKHVPIIFMTARIQPSEIDEYIKMGAMGVIPKPFDPMTLASQVFEHWVKYHEQHTITE